jgi:hypothetical protein
LSACPSTSEQNRARTLYAATSAARIGRIPLSVPTAAGSLGSREESAALPISIKTGRIPFPWPYKLRSSLESSSPSPLISPPSPCARIAPLLDSYLGLPSRQRSGRDGWREAFTSGARERSRPSALQHGLASTLPFPPVEASWCSSSGPERTSSPTGGVLAASTKAGSGLASPRASLSAGAAVAAPGELSPVLDSAPRCRADGRMTVVGSWIPGCAAVMRTRIPFRVS